MVKKLRARCRTPRHPEAIERQLRHNASEKSETSKDVTKSWRWPYGWLVILRGHQGSFDKSASYGGGGSSPYADKHYRDTKTYEEAVQVRDDELASGRYDSAWIIMKTGAQPNR